MPPECVACVAGPAGAAPHPAIKTPLERAPQVDEVRWESTRSFAAGDKT
jgi:hypothetical protein